MNAANKAEKEKVSVTVEKNGVNFIVSKIRNIYEVVLYKQTFQFLSASDLACFFTDPILLVNTFPYNLIKRPKYDIPIRQRIAEVFLNSCFFTLLGNPEFTMSKFLENKDVTLGVSWSAIQLSENNLPKYKGFEYTKFLCATKCQGEGWDFVLSFFPPRYQQKTFR